MKSKVLRSATLSFILSILLCCISSCTPAPEGTPTEPPSSPPPIQPTRYHLRVEFSCTSDYADFSIYNPEHILSVNLVSISGDPSYYDVTESALVLNQPFDAAKSGGEVGITVDYEIDAMVSEKPLDFKLQSGELNASLVRFFQLIDDEYQLVREVEYRRATSPGGKMYVDFSVDLKTIVEVASERPVPESTAPPSEAASIIFHNGDVLTIDENNSVVEALAIKGDKIFAVGADNEILPLQGEDTILVDLSGQTLMPGFADGHTHVFAHRNRPGSLEEAQEVVLQWGFTSSTEMAEGEAWIEEMMEAEENGQLRLRINVFAMYNYGALTDEGEILYAWQWYPENDPILEHDRMFRIPGIKIFVDGAGVPPRGCPAMSEPYSQESQSAGWFKAACLSPYGDLYWEQTELNQVVADAQAAGFRAAFHAMGDRGIEAALDAIEFALDGEPNDIHRHQIQHSSTLRPDLVDRYVSMDMLSSLRGYFNTCDQDTYENEWGFNRYSLPGLGVHTFLETDFGWTAAPEDDYALRNGNPVMQLYGLVTHKQVLQDGTVCNPDPPLAQHVITVEQALRILTIEPAYAVSQEDYLGSLEPGKFADMIILSDNPLTIDPDNLKDMEVWMTMVGGNIEYCKPGYDMFCP